MPLAHECGKTSRVLLAETKSACQIPGWRRPRRGMDRLKLSRRNRDMPRILFLSLYLATWTPRSRPARRNPLLAPKDSPTNSKLRDDFPMPRSSSCPGHCDYVQRLSRDGLRLPAKFRNSG
jgi:hypothetical protein